MKRFHQYKLSKNDKQIIKNFKLDIEFRELSKEELKSYLSIILNYTNLKSQKIEKKFKKFFSTMLYYAGYVSVINGQEIFFFDFNQKNFYNICFYNMSNISENNINHLTNSKESIEIFKVMCSIFIQEYSRERSQSYKVQLPIKFSKLFFKLIDKSLKQYYLYSRLIVKKIKNRYYYYISGKNKYNSLSYLKGEILSYKKPFIDVDSYVRKFKAK